MIRFIQQKCMLTLVKFVRKLSSYILNMAGSMNVLQNSKHDMQHNLVSCWLYNHWVRTFCAQAFQSGTQSCWCIWFSNSGLQLLIKFILHTNCLGSETRVHASICVQASFIVMWAGSFSVSLFLLLFADHIYKCGQSSCSRTEAIDIPSSGF